MTEEVFEQIHEGLSEALSVARREKAIVTDEMVDAFGQKFWSVNAASKIDGQREEIRAALTAALAQSETQPVAEYWTTHNNFENGSMSGKGLVHDKGQYCWDFACQEWLSADTPIFASPVPAKREAGVVPTELIERTFAVQYNPRCPMPWLVRLPGKGGAIDLKPYADGLGFVQHQTGDILGFGTTFEEAAIRALSTSSTPADGEDGPAPVPNLPVCTGCKDKDGHLLFLGDRVRYRLEGRSTKQEYWNPEYEIVWKAPMFTLHHVGGGLDGGNHLFKLQSGGGNGDLELISRGPHYPSPSPNLTGIELAARFVEKRLNDYCAEHGVTDPDTGTVEYPGNGEEYVYELEEIIEGIRALTTEGQP